MALIKCSECGKEISNEATECIFCGKPQGEKIVTVQLTSKKWKKIKLIAVIGIIFGWSLFIHHYNVSKWNDPYTGLGFCIMFFSLITLFVGKFGAWWNNR